MKKLRVDEQVEQAIIQLDLPVIAPHYETCPVALNAGRGGSGDDDVQLRFSWSDAVGAK